MKTSTKIIIFLSVLLVLILLAFGIIYFFNQPSNESKQLTLLSSEDKKDTAIVTPVKRDTLPQRLPFLKPDSLEIPSLPENTTITSHTGFSLCYSEEHEQAFWVAYEFTKAETNKKVDRTDNFKPDPKISTKSADDQDYKKSGYDRGHLAAAADMAWSLEAMNASFYYSNMSPQTPSFNRGIWKKLEEQVRDWVMLYDTLYVVTGPVLTKGLPAIGPNKVSVPNYYYKVILDYKKSRQQAIGFLLPNQKSSLPLRQYVVSVDSIEKLTSIDFFFRLEDNQEQFLEQNLCANCWQW